MRRVIGGIILALTMVVVSACGGGSGPADTSAVPAASITSQEDSSSRPTLTAPSLQPPAQEGQYINKDRPDVVFDPCTWVGDEAVREAGFDPKTRDRGEDFVAEWTFLVCGFDSEVLHLTLMSGNVSLEEVVDKSLKNGPWQTSTEVNGREATMGVDPENPDACEINLRTSVGVLFVHHLLKLKGRTQGVDPCSGIEKTAALIEQEIGEGN